MKFSFYDGSINLQTNAYIKVNVERVARLAFRFKSSMTNPACSFPHEYFVFLQFNHLETAKNWKVCFEEQKEQAQV